MAGSGWLWWKGVVTSALMASLPAYANAPAIVAAPAGTVQGETLGKVHVFKGIRYAQPPVGASRWKPPQPAAKWEGTRDATK